MWCLKHHVAVIYGERRINTCVVQKQCWLLVVGSLWRGWGEEVVMALHPGWAGCCLCWDKLTWTWRWVSSVLGFAAGTSGQALYTYSILLTPTVTALRSGQAVFVGLGHKEHLDRCNTQQSSRIYFIKEPGQKWMEELIVSACWLFFFYAIFLAG